MFECYFFSRQTVAGKKENSENINNSINQSPLPGHMKKFRGCKCNP